MILQQMKSDVEKEVKKVITVEKEMDEAVKAIIVNNTRGIPQYKILIPKKMANTLKIDKGTHVAKFTLTKEGTKENKIYKLNINIEKNGQNKTS
jgi:hypothetical protein